MKLQINPITIDQIVKQLAEGAGNNVVSGYLTGKIEGNNIIIEGVYIPKQRSNDLFTIFEIKAQLRAVKTIYRSGKRIVGLAQYNRQYAVSIGAGATLQNLVFTPKIELAINNKGEYKIIY